MDIETFHINEFQHDPSLGNDLELLLTVKSFNLDEIRKRYLASRKNNGTKVGSVERRKAATGALVKVKLGQDSLAKHEIIHELIEPRGITKLDDLLVYSSEDKVIVKSNQEQFQIENEWFSYIHALDISPFDKRKLLISSSGLDCIFEYDLEVRNLSWEWFAWEKYRNEATDPKSGGPIFLTRNTSEYNKLKDEGFAAKLISDPTNEYLPTAMRAAFINSVSYSRTSPNKIIATLFHEGRSIEIDIRNNEINEHIGNLSNPHGGWSFASFDMITSTGSGEVIIQRGEKIEKYTFAGLRNKHIEMGEKEWIQNSIVWNDCIISIDSNRTSLIIFNPIQRSYNQMVYPDNWAIQDMVVVG